MTNTAEVDFVVTLAHDILLQVAPEEGRVFERQAEAYRSDPALLHSRTTRDDPLGSAYGTVAPLLAPVAFDLAKKVWDKLTDKTVEGALTHSGRALGRWFRGRAEPVLPQPLSAEALAGLHQYVLDLTGERHWTPEQQAAAADTTISALARMKLVQAQDGPAAKP